jgi:outer membrane immunogenic protein
MSGVPTQMNAKGGFFGGQVGFNWQIGPIVWGAEADYQGASQSGTTCGFVGCIVTVTTPPFPAGTTTANSTVYQKVKWFSTARARVGYANEGAMIYVTGGGAWMGIDETDSFSLSSSFPPPASAATAASFSNSKSGYSVGAGLEMRLWADLTAKVEYLHLDVSGTTNSALHVAGIAFGALVQTTTTGRIKDDIVRVGLNWKFSGFGFGGPVYAAY